MKTTLSERIRPACAAVVVTFMTGVVFQSIFPGSVVAQANSGGATPNGATSVPVSAQVSDSLIGSAPNTLSEKEKSDGWRLLFDGKNPSENWRGYRKEVFPEKWVVEDGALVGQRGGDIITREQFENFELSIEWKISEGGNSGIMFRVQESEKAPWQTGPEIQILDNVGGKDPNKAGWMYALYPASVDTTKPAGQWNHFRLVTQNGNCEHWMNGAKYVEYSIGSEDWNQKVAKSKFGNFPAFAKSARGHICLQDHGNLVWYRSIKIRALP